jgi:hypothetical protein
MQAGAPKVQPIFTFHQIQDLEDQLVAALYRQRACEDQLLQSFSKSSEMQELQDDFCAAKTRVNQLANKIRSLRHGY